MNYGIDSKVDVNELLIDGDSLSIEQIADVSKNYRKVTLAYKAVEKIEQSISNKIMNGPKALNVCYQNFDEITEDQIKKLEINQFDNINSIPVSAEIVRAIMLICINSYSKGFLRIGKETILTFLEMLNNGVHPVIKENGVNGSLADIYPLSQILLVMKGLGMAEYKGRIMSGREAMKRACIRTLNIDKKEEIEMINGPYVMIALSALAVHNALILSRTADISSSLTLEAMKYDIEPYDTVQNPKPHKGHLSAAYNIMGIVNDSKNIFNGTKMSYYDVYALRCIPQVNGAGRMVIDNSKIIVNTEIDSASYNPLIFSDNDDIRSGLETQGQSIAIAMNTLKLSIKDIINASKQRTKLLNIETTDAVDNLYPAAVNINSDIYYDRYSASLGINAASKAYCSAEEAICVLGNELVCAYKKISRRDINKLGIGSKAAYDTIKKQLSSRRKDSIIAMDAIKKLIIDGTLISNVENITGPLK